MNSNISFSQGVTLIELVVSIVIITIAVSGVMSLFIGTSSTSADPMIRAQQLAIAQSYLDEIIMQPYSNDGATPGRADYNEIDDYNTGGIFQAVQDQFGRTIVSLSGYSVKVDVTPSGLNGVSNIKKIIVTVRHGGLNTEVPMTAYRADY